MTKFVAQNKTYLSAEISYSKGDKIDKLSFDKIKNIVTQDLIKVGLVKKENIGQISENKEDFVYPVQFTDYKHKLSKVSAKDIKI